MVKVKIEAWFCQPILVNFFQDIYKSPFFLCMYMCDFEKKIIYLFLAALDLCCFVQAFSSCYKGTLLFASQASVCSGFSCCREGFSSCDTWVCGIFLDQV